jgi:hypothetical protein
MTTATWPCLAHLPAVSWPRLARDRQNGARHGERTAPDTLNAFSSDDSKDTGRLRWLTAALWPHSAVIGWSTSGPPFLSSRRT